MPTASAITTQDKPKSASQRLWQSMLPEEAKVALMEEMQDELEIDIEFKAKIKVRRTRGRPIKYRPEFGKVAYNLFTNPAIVATTEYVSEVLGISRDTFYRWKREHEEFARAVDAGKACQEAVLCKHLLSQNPKAIQESMHALKRLHHWKD